MRKEYDVMNTSSLLSIQGYGQSIWLDYLRRSLLTSGELQRLVEEDGLRGVTSNPAIFEKVIDGSNDYSAAIRALALEGKKVNEIYDTLTIDDVQQAADIFRPVYDRTGGRDGFVSLEVSPHLANNTQDTIKEARRLWNGLGRPNVLIKVPATLEGLPAIAQLISEGINVNVTLLFGLDRYRAVADAYLTGLEKRLNAGKSIDRIASVASFFLSRIDVMVDPMLDKLIDAGGTKAEKASSLRGTVAVTSAKLAYRIYKEIFGSERFRRLADKGAHTQRLLWASTSTKNPEYSDIKYVEALIGPDTVNTAPMETLNAYRDHGQPAARLADDLDKYEGVLRELGELGIDITVVAQRLEDEGIGKFNAPFDRLMESLKKHSAEASAEPVDQQHLNLGKYQKAVTERMAEMAKNDFGSRFWRKDGSLWKNDSESQEMIKNSMGWLHCAEKMIETAPRLKQFASEVKAAGFERVVHMGMGGSSLAPLVFERSFSTGKDGLPVTVLDTTDPATILKIEREAPVEKTLFIVASKSGTTSEPNAFGEYFYDKVREKKGESAGDNFVAITDPETPLVDLARQRKYRAVFLNFVDIGGRYSALSYFGMIPAALMGLPIDEILERAVRMRHACSSCVKIPDNPGLALGAAIGELARQGRDKLTFLTPESLSTLGMWLEQLLAESTGKEGKGVLPVADEPLGEPPVYGNDRVFVRIVSANEEDKGVEKSVENLIKPGHPVITIRLKDALDVAQEFLRWEIATATAGAIIGINAFDQPNVQESKDNTKRLLGEVVRKGHLDEAKPSAVSGSLKIFAGTKITDAETFFRIFLSQAGPNDYVALQAYVTETPEIEQALQALRTYIRDHLHLASTHGYGPRFLHSTGQYHKGGPNTGLFVQLTADDGDDQQIPGKPYTFGVLRRAQAQGDLEALRKHGRRAVRIHLGDDILKGVDELKRTIAAALTGIGAMA
jgi:transaldolase/glucose-6-phosphate isomerase